MKIKEIEENLKTILREINLYKAIAAGKKSEIDHYELKMNFKNGETGIINFNDEIVQLLKILVAKHIEVQEG